MTKDYTKYDFHDKKNNVHYTKLHKNGLAKEIIIYLLKEDIVKRHEVLWASYAEPRDWRYLKKPPYGELLDLSHMLES